MHRKSLFLRRVCNHRFEPWGLGLTHRYRYAKRAHCRFVTPRTDRFPIVLISRIGVRADLQPLINSGGLLE
uniref:Uncharacterized protein n=1 Tax=Ralstonia solanacearum TaxID=305 RepID=A0A0S4V467_RALSL|nr:protein of unknown function [Ralstonia solanacearum]